jgi:hypothetical protein
MEKFKVGYYKANTAQGVFYYDTILDEPETDVLPIKMFIDSLPTVEDDEEITTFFGPGDKKEWLEMVKEYNTDIFADMPAEPDFDTNILFQD